MAEREEVDWGGGGGRSERERESHVFVQILLSGHVPHPHHVLRKVLSWTT